MNNVLHSPLLELAERLLAPYRTIASCTCRMASMPEVERLKATLLAPGPRTIPEMETARRAAPERR
jgi:hypothetical protein